MRYLLLGVYTFRSSVRPVCPTIGTCKRPLTQYTSSVCPSVSLYKRYGKVFPVQLAFLTVRHHTRHPQHPSNYENKAPETHIYACTLIIIKLKQTSANNLKQYHTIKLGLITRRYISNKMTVLTNHWRDLKEAESMWFFRYQVTYLTPSRHRTR